MTPPYETWRTLLRSARERVGEADARRIVERAAGLDGAALVLALDDPVPERVGPFVDSMVDRRLAGEPLQYVVGRWGFRGLDLLVDRRVLIPRPETEQVVEVALRELGALASDAPRVVDLGTGSGAIALSIAVEAPRAEVWATDVSAEALSVARANLAGVGGLAATRVSVVHGSWFDALTVDLERGFDLIVSNPPYVPDGAVLPDEVAQWEPAGALRSGAEGLDAIAIIVSGAPRWLRRPGVLVIELSSEQAEAAISMASAAGFDHAEVRPDLAGRARSLVARLNQPDSAAL
ncbi:MAG TPA: peptide chain release factor N(5)-glutamine methyltransferase [Acidimicrobiales bacterium]|nr:peptide chain release factor N(5)-glutamine methyltransferase [Acidimicrobiales bacterium]